MSNQQTADHRILIAFGANLGDREATARRAQEEIAARIGPILRASSLMENPPLVLAGEDPALHPWFLNAVWLAQTILAPQDCLHQLLEIERIIGRVRERRWGPRLIDLDLLAYDDLVLELPGLVIPHPALHDRLFVLQPLCEVLPDWIHPVKLLSAEQLLKNLLR